MKTTQNFGIYYILMVIIQIVICNFCEISPYITLTILPALVLCLPTNISTVTSMLIAFATGLCVDLLGDGVIGLNAFALVPTALIRKDIMQNLFDKDSVERDNGFSFRKNGLGSISMAVLILSALFLAAYILADGAGTRTLRYNLVRFALSCLSSLVLGLLCVRVFTNEDKR